MKVYLKEVVLSQRDARNLIAVLMEWHEVFELKPSLGKGDVGLDFERFHILMGRLSMAANEQNEIAATTSCEAELYPSACGDKL